MTYHNGGTPVIGDKVYFAGSGSPTVPPDAVAGAVVDLLPATDQILVQPAHADPSQIIAVSPTACILQGYIFSAFFVPHPPR